MLFHNEKGSRQPKDSDGLKSKKKLAKSEPSYDEALQPIADKLMKNLLKNEISGFKTNMVKLKNIISLAMYNNILKYADDLSKEIEENLVNYLFGKERIDLGHSFNLNGMTNVLDFRLVFPKYINLLTDRDFKRHLDKMEAKILKFGKKAEEVFSYVLNPEKSSRFSNFKDHVKQYTSSMVNIIKYFEGSYKKCKALYAQDKSDVSYYIAWQYNYLVYVVSSFDYGIAKAVQGVLSFIIKNETRYIQLDENSDNKIGVFDTKAYNLYEGIEYALANIKSDDVVQAGMADCVLLATLKSLANTFAGRDAIRDCFLDINNEKVKIRFYKLNLRKTAESFLEYCKDPNNKKCYYCIPGGPMVIEVDASKLWYDSTGRSVTSNSVWVRAIEKAYSVYKKQYLKKAIFSRDRLVESFFRASINEAIEEAKKSGYKFSGDFSVSNLVQAMNLGEGEPIAIMAITGKKSKCVFSPKQLPKIRMLSELQESLDWINKQLDIIRKSLQNGRYLTVSFKRSFQAGTFGIIIEHEYSLVGMGKVGSVDCIIVRNPHDEAKDICIPFNTFFNNLNEISKSTSKKI